MFMCAAHKKSTQNTGKLPVLLFFYRFSKTDFFVVRRVETSFSEESKSRQVLLPVSVSEDPMSFLQLIFDSAAGSSFGLSSQTTRNPAAPDLAATPVRVSTLSKNKERERKHQQQQLLTTTTTKISGKIIRSKKEKRRKGRKNVASGAASEHALQSFKTTHYNAQHPRPPSRKRSRCCWADAGRLARAATPLQSP